MNILCSISALVKNQILLSSGIVDELIKIALKNKKFIEVTLFAVLQNDRNKTEKRLSEENLLNICQILKEN